MTDISPFSPPQQKPAPPYQDSRPIAILVLGALGLAMCQVLGGVAWYLAVQYERDCRDRGVKPDQLAVIGKILGMVGVGLFAVMVLGFGLMMLMYLLFFVLWFVFAILTLALGAAGAAVG